MKRYIGQLIVSDNQDTLAYELGAFPTCYTFAIYANCKGDAVEELYKKTWELAPKSSDEYEDFEMLLEGVSPSTFIDSDDIQ